VRSPRVALVVGAFPATSETFIVDQFVGLADRGWDVHVVSESADVAGAAAFPQLRRPDLRRRVHPAGGPLRLAGRLARAPVAAWTALLSGALRAPQAVDAALAALRPAVVHVEFGALAVGRTALVRRLGARLVVSFRGYDVNFAGLDVPGYFDAVWHDADLLHFLGEDLRARALRRGCPPERPYVLVPPAVDAAFFDPGARPRAERAGTPARPLRLLGVGRLVWKKGYEYALQAVRALLDRGVHCEYRIVGTGEHAAAVDHARRQLGLTDAVRLLGALPRAGVRAEMLQADALLHAAVSEGFCNAVLEAQAMELPVVCTDADGLAENVANGRTGFVVPRRDPDAIADRLARLAADPLLRETLGRRGRARVVARFAAGAQLDAFEAVYRRLLGRAVDPAPAPAQPRARAALDLPRCA
jgi:colanic acid/amylovoran biosynthesis glycosyltransferase